MNDSMDFLNANSGGSGNPGVFFGSLNDKVVGEITEQPRQVPTQFGDRLVIELKATEGSTAGKGKKGEDGKIAAGDEVTLWLKPGAMAAAVRDAISNAEAKGLEVGGTLAVAFSGTKDTGKAEPVKLYTAQYKSPVAAVPVGSDLI